MLETIRVQLAVPRKVYSQTDEVLTTRYLIVETDGRVSLPYNLKDLKAEASRRGEKIDFIQECLTDGP